MFVFFGLEPLTVTSDIVNYTKVKRTGGIRIKFSEEEINWSTIMATTMEDVDVFTIPHFRMKHLLQQASSKVRVFK